MSQRVLMLLDAQGMKRLVAGQPPITPFSHDKNLFQFAHEALRRGWTVMASVAQADAATRPAWTVRQIYPTWEQDEAAVAHDQVAADIVVAVFPEALNIRAHYPDAKIVAIHAAVHWLENPSMRPAQYVFDLITAVRYNIDFMVTQNVRMADILQTTYSLLARWPYPERIIVAPLGIVAEERRAHPDAAAMRAEMGLGAHDLAIINAGGTWRWTDFNTFLEAFATHAEAAPQSRLRLFVMGLLQATNLDHGEYVAETEALLWRFRTQLGTRITVYNHWDDAAQRVHAFTACSNVGLNVNQPSLENWQSYRLRFLDYMAAGIPVISTRGDLMSEAEGGRHAFLVDAGDLRAYRETLDAIAAEPALVAEKAEAMRALAREYDSRNTYGEALDRIERMPRRPRDDHGAWGDCVLDYAARHMRQENREATARGIQRFTDWLLQ